MYIRFWPVHISCAIAFKPASIFTRWRAAGALTNCRSKHHPSPPKGTHNGRHPYRSWRRGRPWLQLTEAPKHFLKGLWSGHVRLGRERTHAAGSPPEHVQKLAHLRRLAGKPGEGSDSGCRFRHGGGRMLAQLGGDRRAVWVEDTARPMRLKVFQLLDPAGDIDVESAREARCGKPTPPRDIASGDPLPTQRTGVHWQQSPSTPRSRL
jgi:hypothetical protein